MNTDKKITLFIKQNDAIYNALIAKSIVFTRKDINNVSNDEDKLKLLIEENEELKLISKNNKPIQEPKKVIQPPKSTPQSPSKPPQQEDEEEQHENPVKKFDTITNMEDIKRAFFNKDYELFTELIKQHNFKYYVAEYKYSSDKDGMPDFIAKNLLKGFVRNLDDYRKYLMVCFRCFNNGDKTYLYPSLWILNSTEDINNIIGSLYDDFVFEEINVINSFLNQFQKLDYEENSTLLDECYVH